MALSAEPPPAPVEDVLTRGGPASRRWLATSAVLALAILTVLALGLVWRQYENAKRDATQELGSRAILAATVFDTYFAGQLASLSAIAASPSVTSGDVESMTRYFASFRPGKGGPFNAGVGWIDLEGRQRATSDPRGPTPLSFDDRTYFTSVISTKKPFVAEVIVGRTSDRRIVVMSVATRDGRRRLTGVLAGGLVLPPSRQDARATDLGYAGLEVLDRVGQQITRRDLARPANTELVALLRERKQGVLEDTRGLDGSEGRVVAFASSAAPSWVAVIDRPASTVFGDARRALLIETILIAAAFSVILGLIWWAVRRARRDLRRQRARVSGWAELTRALNAATSVESLRHSLATALAKEFPASSAVVVIDEEAESHGRAVEATRGSGSSLNLDDRTATAVAQAIGDAGGSSLVLETHQILQSRLAPLGVAVIGGRSLYGVPLVDQSGSVEGAAALAFETQYAMTDTDLTLLRAHADQAAQALIRVRRHEQEHDVAVLLQESLLPDELPDVDGVRLAAHYRSGVAGTNAGGDWYDVVRRPDGITHFSVGDVAGRGIRAAVSMGQLRNAFRAYALEHVSPAAVVQRMTRHVERNGMATMVCVTFDPLTYEVVYSSAGHVPPLLVDSEKRSFERLEDSASAPPLGWFGERTTSEKHTSVAPGMSLALYSDGLVERRGVSLDESIDGVAGAILSSSGSPGEAVHAVVGTLADAEQGDDVALLLLQFQDTPGAIRIEIPAEPLVLRELRRRVRRWLTLRGLDAKARDASLLALSEACNNAIEHGYRNRPGTISIALRHDDASLEIRVADNGEWREPRPDSSRGRGMLIMRSLMDETDVVASQDGTEVVLGQRL
jgi:serine phosphatase RsbU (regulator of sigma subunit)/anti-sigma regulatory factor (Ser/Thr protein kinase)